MLLVLPSRSLFALAGPGEFIFAGGLFLVALTQRGASFTPSTDTNHQPTNQP
jgi:hypothetical protein